MVCTSHGQVITVVGESWKADNPDLGLRVLDTIMARIRGLGLWVIYGTPNNIVSMCVART